MGYDRVEVNPFAPDVPAAYLALHPFGRVPALVHDGFALYETAAITRYIDRAFPGPALQPAEPKALARMDQIIGIVDSYGYWPMVRQVFSRRVFRPRLGQPADEAEIAKGLAAAAKVLAALEKLTADAASWSGRIVAGRSASRRDDRLLRAGARRRRPGSQTRAPRRLVAKAEATAELHGNRPRIAVIG